MSEIGNNIKRRRKELGISQKQLADKMGFKSKSSISHVEKDDFDMTTVLLQRYADALYTTPTALMGIDDTDYRVIDTDEVAEIIKNQDLLEMMKLFQSLSKDSRKHIVAEIEFLIEKEKEG